MIHCKCEKYPSVSKYSVSQAWDNIGSQTTSTLPKPSCHSDF